MCLYTNFKEPKIVEEDIICYKIYIISYEGKMLSPYRSVLSPKIGIITTTLLGIPIKVTKIQYCIEEGFHSFARLSDAKYDAKRFSRICETCIVKCIIPRGSSYYKGRFGDDLSYCSNSIKLVEICV